MRLLALLGSGLALGSCGGPPVSPLPALTAPPMVLRSQAGVQHAPLQKWCAGETSTYTLCGATHFATFAGRLPTMSVVRPGERIRIVTRGAQSIRLAVRAYGCPRAAPRRVSLGPAGAWRVDLGPGRYRLRAVVPRFETGRTTGNTSASFGIWVDRTRKLELLVPPRTSAC